MLHFLDFECYKKLWTCVIINPFEQKKTVLVNDRQTLEDYYRQHRNEIFIGYNIRGYDQYMYKGILCDFDPYKITKWIIVDKKNGYNFSKLLNNFPLNFYEVGSKMRSLKELEGFMGNDIRETTIPFDYEGEFTQEMIDEVIFYNTHDVEQLIEVFMAKIDDFNAHMDLIKTFNLPLSYVCKSQAQLTAAALGCVKQYHNDEWNISFVPTIRLSKYKKAWDWFKNPVNYQKGDKLDITVCGVPHTLGLGGIHGAPLVPIYRKGLIIHVDVTSYYPSLMIEYDLLSRNVKDKSVFKQVYDKRVALKKAGKKKEQAPYKIILNSTFGITNDEYSSAYDPRRNHEVTINGQLLLLDLLEKLEGYCELIQSNTDGLIIKIPDTDEAFNKIDDICAEWEKRTGMNLGFDIIKEIWQKDVNNYVYIAEDGSIERKGAYVKELSPLDNDLPIINEALVNYMTKHELIEDTIYKCDELIKFQKIVKLSGKYHSVWHNNKELTDKTFRVFASKDLKDTSICKRKLKKEFKDDAYGYPYATGKTYLSMEKFANTPEHCFIDNSDVKEKKVPLKLDKNWYIELANERLRQFGIK